MTTHDNAPPPDDWRPEPRCSPFDKQEPPIVVPANIELGGRAD